MPTGYTYSGFNQIITLNTLAKEELGLDVKDDYELDLKTTQILNLKTRKVCQIPIGALCDFLIDHPDYQAEWNVLVEKSD